MAGLLFSLNPTPVTLATATGPRTLLQIVSPANQRVIVEEMVISCNGVTAADPPVLFEILYQTTAGTSVSLTPVKWNDADTEAIQTTALQTFSSTEPTSGNVIWNEYLHMQTGDRETGPSIRVPGFTIAGGKKLALRFTSGTVTGTVKCAITAKCEE